jgi:hypothetical protein
MDLRSIQNGIQERQEELHRLADILARVASKKGRQAAVARVATIVLGAFVATNAVATKLWGNENSLVVVVYALAGLVIAAASGMEAAFKVEARAAGLRALAAKCQGTIWQIDSEWRKSVGAPDTDSYEAGRLKSARALLDRQDQVLGDVQVKAADLGENITLEVRSLYGPEMPAAA